MRIYVQFLYDNVCLNYSLSVTPTQSDDG